MSYIGKLDPPPSLPPEILRFLLWLDKTEGRDKLYRLIVYATKYLQSALQSFVLSDPLERAASSLKGFSLALWLLCDHIQWLSTAGYIRLLPDTAKRIDAYHSQAWFSGLLFAAVLALYRLQQLVKQEQVIVEAAAGSLDNNTTAQVQRQLVALQYRKAKHIIDVVKNGTDLIIPAARLGWIDVSGQTVGLAGTITSLIGIWQTYPAKE